MIYKLYHLGSYAANIYVIGDEATNEVFVIDAGDDMERLIRKLDENGFKVKSVLITHGHFDHTNGIKQLKEATGARVYMNKKDSFLVKDPECIDGDIAEGDVFTIGRYSFTAIETPGHTPGGISLLCDGMLFSGDTLFRESIGRTDLEGGDYGTLIDSIKNKLMTLDDEIKVFPGHGFSTTIGRERKNNPFL